MATKNNNGRSNGTAIDRGTDEAVLTGRDTATAQAAADGRDRDAAGRAARLAELLEGVKAIRERNAGDVLARADRLKTNVMMHSPVSGKIIKGALAGGYDGPNTREDFWLWLDKADAVTATQPVAAAGQYIDPDTGKPKSAATKAGVITGREAVAFLVTGPRAD